MTDHDTIECLQLLLKSMGDEVACDMATDYPNNNDNDQISANKGQNAL